MAEKDTITTKFKIDISDLKKGITEANNHIKLANSEFKKASAGMDDWAKSSDGIKAKLDQLKTVLEAQNSKLKSYEQQLQAAQKYEKEAASNVTKLKQALDQAKNTYGENSRKVKELQTQLTQAEKAELAMKNQVSNLTVTLNNQEATVKETEKEIKKYQTSLKEIQSEEDKTLTATEKLTKEIEEQEKVLNEVKNKYKDVILEHGKDSEAAKNLASKIKDLSSKLSDNKKQLNDTEEATDKLDKSLSAVGKTTKGTSDGFTVLKGSLASLLADGIRKVISSLKEFASETITVGKEFDASMSEVAVISGATDEDLQRLRDTAKEFGAKTKFSASESADALKYMALAGWDTNQSVDALGGILNLAAASGMELGKASDMVTDYLSAFGLEAKDSAYFADMLAYSQSKSNTSAEQLGEAYKNCAANMNAAGQDVETTTSLLAMLANQGLKGSEAGTALTAVMRDMTAKMKDGAIQIGDTSVQVMDANGNYRDMTDILRDVEVATNGMGDAERATALQSTFTSDSIKGLNLILNAGVDEAAKFEEGLRKSTGSAEEMSAVMQDNLNGDLSNLSSKFEGAKIAMYEKFEPAMRDGVEVLSGFIDVLNWIIDHEGEISAALVAMGAGVAAYIGYTGAIKLMELGWSGVKDAIMATEAAQKLLNFTMNASPIGVVIAVIVALTAAIVVLWNKSETFRTFWINTWENLKSSVSQGVESINNGIARITGKIDELKTKAKEKFDEIKNAAKTLFDGIVPKLELKLPKVTMTGGEPPFGIGGYGSLPKFNVQWNARGGIFTRPTVVATNQGLQGFGEAGAEALVPLERNKYWIGKVAQEMVRELKSFSPNNSISNLTNNNNTNNFTQIINAPKQPSRIELYRQTKNLLELKGVY